MEYGLQLYSVRDMMEKDVQSTLRAVAEIGYTSVEFAGLFDHNPAQIREWLDAYGLRCLSMHSQLSELENDYDATISAHKTLGSDTVVIPWYTLSNASQMDELVQAANRLVPRLAADGMRLAYHNHSHEFGLTEDGVMPFSHIECRTGLLLELDTYWAFVGKTNPIAVIERLKDRICFLHVKDGTADASCGKPLGQGDAPVTAVVKKAKELGIPMIVESENLQPDGLTEVRTCFEYLKTLSI